MTEDSDNYLYTTSDKMMVEYMQAYHALAKDEDPTVKLHEYSKDSKETSVEELKDYVVKWQKAKKEKQPMKKQVKKKLAAPQPKKGAKKKTTYLYGGPAK
jgi:predicted urease superfamily metal-dependent hydrolase